MQRSWLIRFAATLGALALLALWTALRLPAYRDPPYDFLAMAPGEYFDPDGLTRRQGGSVKLGFAETRAPPPVGVFGNHIVTFFGADAFDAPEQGELFFNYSYANLSLPETLQLLRHLEALHRLPTELMIVALTPPNADNGRFIIDHGEELPPDMALEDVLRPGADPSPAQLGQALWRTFETRLHEVFNYNTLVLGLLQNPSRARATGPAGCEREPPRRSWLAGLPWTLRRLFPSFVVYSRCEGENWDWSLRRDGSAVAPLRPQDFEPNEDPLAEKTRGLKAGDEVEIARLMREIDAVGRRGGASVVFLVPPVYETDRRDSVVNQVLDRALALAPGLAVIDHRHMHDDKALFTNAIHPAPEYYRLVAEELRRRGYLQGIEGEGPIAGSGAP